MPSDPSTSAPVTKPMFKNLPFAQPTTLVDLVDHQDSQVVSRTLAQNKALTVTLFAFAAGEGLSTHHSSGDALVQVLEGTGQFTIEDQAHRVPQGQSIVLPANRPHAVYAKEAFKMLLTVVKPG